MPKCWGARFFGRKAGFVNRHGYLRVAVDDCEYQGHRIIWRLVTGEEPEEIDHINGVRSDNRLCNLRSVDTAENAKNRCNRIDNTSGHIGITFTPKTRRWRVQINANGKRYHVGYFGSIADAARERDKLYSKLGFHENHGRRT